MLPDVIRTFITNEQIPIAPDQAFAIYIALKGNVFATLSALRTYEENMYAVYAKDVEAKARELNAQLALRAREHTGVSIECAPRKTPAARIYSMRELEELLLA